jgi:hypothetical protein
MSNMFVNSPRSKETARPFSLMSRSVSRMRRLSHLSYDARLLTAMRSVSRWLTLTATGLLLLILTLHRVGY